MSNITINNKARTIEINKTFAAASSKYGSAEYKELQDARRDYPDFRVVTIKQKGAKAEFKGLTYDYMKDYISKHDDEDKSKMAQFQMMRGAMSNDEVSIMDAADYADVKEWFLQTFPEFEAFRKAREALIKQIEEAKAKRLAQREAEKHARLSA